MSRVLITGINGFIGSHLSHKLEHDGWGIQALSRDRPGNSALPLTLNDSIDDFARAFEKIDAIVHLAGIAHRQASPDAYQTINDDWPVRLFQGAITAGVKSFIHMSSIKVLGDVSERPFQPGDTYQPSDPYAQSKAMAERHLLEQDNDRTSLAIIRSPLAYGPEVRANFGKLLKLAVLGRQGLPLPLGDAEAPRSMVARENLCNLIAVLLASDFRGSRIFHVCDERDWTVRDLLQLWGVRSSRLWRVPTDIVRPVSQIIGQQATFQRLFRPLQVDQSATLAATPWRPVGKSADHLNETLSWYLNNH